MKKRFMSCLLATAMVLSLIHIQMCIRDRGQAVGREQSKAVYLPVNVAASHGQGTEAVQIALYNDIGQGGNGGLKPGGNAEF